MKRQYAISIGMLLLGLLLGYFFFAGPSSQEGKEGSSSSASKKETTYTCSMHPQVRKKEPGQCPICGMDLIPVDDMSNDSKTVLEMSENAVQIADIRTSEVQKLDPEKSVRMQGEVEVDERRLSSITARFPGRIEKLYVDYTGQRVRKGQKLASIYSPELIAAQRELFEAMKEGGRDSRFFEAAKSKLKLWDLGEEEIQAIIDSGAPQEQVDIRAPHSGIVQERKVTVGEYLSEGDPLFKLADLSRVWVIFHAYEQDLPWLDEGDRVDFEVAGIPDRNFESRIRFIHPTMKENTRTVSIRAEASNPSGQLRPGMFATGKVDAELDLDGPRTVVPSSAVLWSGKRSIVYVEVPNTEKPTFEFREVELGADLGGARIVESGLEEGEQVVTNGTFRVDAASQLAGKKSMMQRLDQGKEAGSSEEKGQGGMEMGKAKDVDLDISGILEAYLELKNALVGSASEDAHQQAIALQNYLDELEKGLSKEAEEVWSPYGKEIRKAAERIEKHSDSLDEQRKAFHTISDRMVEAVRIWGTGGKKIYKDHCPMAFEGEGADWLSEFETIKNPYYGEEMLECGSVKERFGE